MRSIALVVTLLSASCPAPAAHVEIKSVASGSLPSDGWIEVTSETDVRVSVIDEGGHALAPESFGRRVVIARRTLAPHASRAHVRVVGDGFLRVVAVDENLRPFVSLEAATAALAAGEPRAALVELEATRGGAHDPGAADALAAEAAFAWGRTHLAEHYATRGLTTSPDAVTEARLQRALLLSRAEAVRPFTRGPRRSVGPLEDALDAALELRLAELDDRNLGGPPRAPAAARVLIERAAGIDVGPIAGALCRAGGHLNDGLAIARGLARANVADAAICHVRAGDAAADAGDLAHAELEYQRALDGLAGHMLPRELREAWFSAATVADARGDRALAFARAKEACRHVEALLALEDGLGAREDLLRNVLGYVGSATALGIRAGDAAGAIELAESGKSRVLGRLLAGATLDETATGGWFSRGSDARPSFDRRVLHEGDAAISYLLLGGGKLAIGVVTANETTARVVHAPSESLIAAHGAAIAANDAVAAEPLARQLYDTLMKPVAPALRGARRLLISPHLRLHGLSFAALHDGERFLVERFAIARIPPLPLLTLETKAARRFVAAISPVSPGMPLLPGFSAPAAAVTHRGLDATIEHILGADADGLIYAGHARYNDGAPLDSALLLSDGALTSAAILRARKRFDTVVLIGCETARTQGARPSYGDDAIGLSRAFLASGARRVIGALWPLLDRDGEDLLGALATRDFDEAQRCLATGACASRGIATWGSFVSDVR